jgi:hypothetical protein
MPTHSDLLSKVRIKVMLQLTVRWSVCLGVRHPFGTHDQICITVRQLRVCLYGTSSQMKGAVLQCTMLLGITSTVILRSKSHRTHDYILLCQIWLTPTWMAVSLYLYPTRTGWPSYTPRHWVSPTPFSVSTYTRNLLAWTCCLATTGHTVACLVVVAKEDVYMS